jgi:sugar phosphate isomerase/epimerase
MTLPFVLACQERLAAGATLAERLANIKRYGFDAVEVMGTSLVQQPDETRAALRAAGLPVSTICAGFEGSLVHPEPTLRRKAIDDCKRLLDWAEDIDAVGLIIAADYGAPPLPDLRPAIEPARLLHDLLLAGLRELGQHLRGMKAALLVEPLNRYESRALRHTADGVALCEESGSPNIKVMFDIFHMTIEEKDPLGALSAAGGRLGHVHLADSNRQVPGAGHIDFGALVRVLCEMGYTGAAALECQVSGDPDTVLPRCVALLRQAGQDVKERINA